MNKYLVEFLGTLFLSFIVFTTGNYLAIGAAIAIIVFLGGPISGGSFNPAVTFALMAAGKIPRNDVIGYIIAEIAGALLGFEIYKNFLNKSV